jgi:hypothetical protein
MITGLFLNPVRQKGIHAEGKKNAVQFDGV